MDGLAEMSWLSKMVKIHADIHKSFLEDGCFCKDNFLFDPNNW